MDSWIANMLQICCKSTGPGFPWPLWTLFYWKSSLTWSNSIQPVHLLIVFGGLAACFSQRGLHATAPSKQSLHWPRQELSLHISELCGDFTPLNGFLLELLTSWFLAPTDTYSIPITPNIPQKKTIPLLCKLANGLCQPALGFPNSPSASVWPSSPSQWMGCHRYGCQHEHRSQSTWWPHCR